MALKILLVDDSPSILNLLSKLLHQSGFHVITAHDGVEALKLLKNSSVDLMMTDINMPRMDGYTLTKQLRADERFRQLPIILLSTESSPRDQRRGLELGADLYLVKPIPPAEMVKRIKQLLEDKKIPHV